MIQDEFGRVHNYLRLSLTDNCNLRCFYCMPDEDYDFTPAARLMQTEEVKQLARLFVTEGVTKIRLTGGEPLVRKDAAKIIESLSELPVELVMTTNATRIHEFIAVLKTSSIKTINISFLIRFNPTNLYWLPAAISFIWCAAILNFYCTTDSM